MHILTSEETGQHARHLVKMGMRAVIRDLQDWADARYDDSTASELRAYLLTQLIVAGEFDGQS